MGQQSPESAPDPDVDGAVLAGWVEARKFSTVRLRPSYDRDEVDAFADAIRDTFLGTSEPPLTPDEIRTKQFSTTRLRPGYDEDEVDAFLDEAESRLAAQPSIRAHAAQQRSAAAGPAAGTVQIKCLECGADSAEATPVCAWCGADVDGAVLAGWVEARRFSRTRLRPGYDMVQVDLFLREIRDTFLGILEPSLTPGAIRTKQFPTTRLVPGYDYEEVDVFLDEAESRLAAQPSTRAHAAYQPSVAGDHAVGQRVSRGWSAPEVVMVGGVILVVIVFVLVIIPWLSGWRPGP